MNQTLQTISSRFSCRQFVDKSISVEDLQTIANAGVQSPSSMNEQNWHIVVLTNRELIEQLDKDGLELMQANFDKEVYQRRVQERGGKFLHNAAAVVFIAIKDASIKNAELIDLGIISQNIVIAAKSIGIDSCHLGFGRTLFDSDKADEYKTKLKFPKGYKYGHTILLGYAKETKAPHPGDMQKVTFIN